MEREAGQLHAVIGGITDVGMIGLGILPGNKSSDALTA